MAGIPKPAHNIEFSMTMFILDQSRWQKELLSIVTSAAISRFGSDVALFEVKPQPAMMPVSSANVSSVMCNYH